MEFKPSPQRGEVPDCQLGGPAGASDRRLQTPSVGVRDASSSMSPLFDQSRGSLSGSLPHILFFVFPERHRHRWVTSRYDQAIYPRGHKISI